jgi:hypothetical protein
MQASDRKGVVMSDKISTQAIKTFYLNDDPTLIMETPVKALDFTLELQKQVRQRLEQMAQAKLAEEQAFAELALAHKDTAEDPFSHDYISQRLELAILEAESNNNTDEVRRLQGLLYKMQGEELSPIQVVRQAWFKG